MRFPPEALPTLVATVIVVEFLDEVGMNRLVCEVVASCVGILDGVRSAVEKGR